MARTLFSFAVCLLSIFVMSASEPGTPVVTATTIVMSRTPKANTHDAVKAYVETAAGIVAKNGPSCDTFRQSTWSNADYYIIVVGADDRIVCHPNAQLVGKLNAEIIDAKGKHVGQAITAVTQTRQGRGWVDYVWPRPGTTTPVSKSTYAIRVMGPEGKSYIVAGGGYELK